MGDSGLLCTCRNSLICLILGVGPTNLAFCLVFIHDTNTNFKKTYQGNSYSQICKEILEMANNKSSNATRESDTNMKKDWNNIV